MSKPMYLPKGWRAGPVKLGRKFVHDEVGGIYIRVPKLDSAVFALFANGEQGGWYDPSDFTTLFQDSAGTTPVTAAGQPVGLMRDKSGRGNHLSQATATARPLIQQDASGLWYLQPDGVDDRMTTASFDPATDKVLVCAGIRKVSDAVQQDLFALNFPAGANRFRMGCPNAAASTSAIFVSQGSIVTAATGGVGAAPQQLVLSGIGDISGDSVFLRRNGTQIATSVADQGTGNYGVAPLELFTSASFNPFNGRFYGGIVRFSPAASTPSEISTAEAWVNSKTGAF